VHACIFSKYQLLVVGVFIVDFLCPSDQLHTSKMSEWLAMILKAIEIVVLYVFSLAAAKILV
jgi:hypothetical protein